jgi:hypothetical protein
MMPCPVPVSGDGWCGWLFVEGGTALSVVWLRSWTSEAALESGGSLASVSVQLHYT